GISKTYDLDVDSQYQAPLSKQEDSEIKKEINKLEDLRKKKDKEVYTLLEDPKISQTSKKINTINEQIMNNDEEDRYLIGQYSRAERAGTPEQIKKIEDKLDANQKEIEKLRQSKKSLIKDNPDYKKLENLEEEITKLDSGINGLDQEKKFGKLKSGIWGQVISSEDGDSKVSYSEFIEGFPVIKNTNSEYYYGEVYRFDLGYTVSGQRLSTPKIRRENVDILNLVVDSKYQTCADTQVELYSMWKLRELQKGNANSIDFKISNGETLQYKSDGTYTIWDGKKVISKQFEGDIGEGFDSWITNVQTYSNTGSLKSSLTPVSEINDLKPGDIFTLHPDPKTGYGHTVAIKEIIRIPPNDIDGKIYYKIFAGSDPATNPEIFKKLYSQDEIIDKIKNNDALALRFN
ncbi:MAG: DUF4846 domain-containing protein, partial [Nanoarchaeota archaeon]